MAKILVVGGTGTVGRGVVKGLRERGLEPRVLAREPDRARELLGGSVEIVRGDLTDPASLTSALGGIEVAYLATTPAPELAQQEGNFVEAARAARLQRLVKLSGYGITQGTDRIHQAHATSERLIKGSGLDYVLLQPAMFMSNLLWEANSIKSGQIVSIFGDGRMSFVDPADVAAVAVVALTEPGLQREQWGFGGPAALSWDDLAATFSRVLGRAVNHVRLDEETFRREAPLPEIVVEAITTAAAMARQGKYEVPDDLVQKKLGRPANDLERWITAHRAAFVA